MNSPLSLLDRIKQAIASIFHGPAAAAPPAKSRADDSLFQCDPGTGGFVDARVRKERMKGNTFHWRRVGVAPASGSHFEIRPKGGSSVLVPEVPRGTDDIFADANGTVVVGTIYRYSLWQVLADGTEKELHDPELEIAT